MEIKESNEVLPEFRNIHLSDFFQRDCLRVDRVISLMEGPVDVISYVVYVTNEILVLKLPNTTPSGLSIGMTFIITDFQISSWKVSLYSNYLMNPFRIYELHVSLGWMRPVIRITFFLLLVFLSFSR